MSDAPSSSPVSVSSGRRLFGTDGVRGVANTELSPQLALALGAAAAIALRSESGSREIMMGRDPRISGDLLGAALVAGLCSQGMNVTALGVLPTPGVAYVTKERGAAAGIVISASHNPVQDNGIKFFGPNGRKLADAVEERIEAAMVGWEAQPRPSGGDVGRLTRSSAPVEMYEAHLKKAAGPEGLAGLRLVIDCANGAASFLAPALISDLGADVVTLCADPDGVNINEDCGSTHPEGMAARVVAEGAHAGLAFDGDADRVILADERGRIFDGDRILCAAGIHLKKQGRLPNDTVVGTVMSNMGLEAALSTQGVRLVRASVGDRYVAEQMNAHGAIIGGEKSGHILFSEYTTTGDGLLTALLVLRLCRESGRTLAEWADEMQDYPQKLVSIKVRERDGWNQIPEITEAIERAEARLAGRGRLNVRPSGTEKMIRVMAEGPDAAEVEEVVELVAGVIRNRLGL
jgi:phosphoglucosamine mutase